MVRRLAGWFVVAVALWMLGNAAAQAGPGKGERTPDRVFSKLDKNSDGKVTLEELKGRGKQDPAKVAKRFAKMDKNGDGSVCKEEFKAAMEKAKGKGKAKGEAKGEAKGAF